MVHEGKKVRHLFRASRHALFIAVPARTSQTKILRLTLLNMPLLPRYYADQLQTSHTSACQGRCVQVHG